MNAAKLLLSIALLIPLTGCWSRVEMDELTFVFGLFVDQGKQPGTVEIAISTPLPNRLMSGQQAGSGGQHGNTYSMITGSGPTIPEALSNIQKDLTRQLSLGHIKVIVVSQAYAKAGLSDLLEWVSREPTIPLGIYILASPDTAKKAAQITPVYEQLPSEVLLKMAESGFMFTTTMKDVLMGIREKTGTPVNLLTPSIKPPLGEGGPEEGWRGFQGALLLQGDQMRSVMELETSRALAWAAGGAKSPTYSVEWDEGKSRASVVFLSRSSSTKVKMTPQGPVFRIRLKGGASVIFNTDFKRRQTSEVSSVITDQLEQKLSKELKQAIKLSQKSGCDVLRLGQLLEWNHPAQWRKLKEKWEDYYRNDAQIEVSADFHLVDFGSSK